MYLLVLRTLSWILMAIIVASALFLLTTSRGWSNWYQTKIVLSGSMEPALPVGSVVVVRAAPQYDLGDVITFAPSAGGTPVTHRVIGNTADGRYVTQGDANDTPDQTTVAPADVLGSVRLTVPYVGYALSFLQTRAGVWLVVLAPALLLVVLEIWSVYQRRNASVA